MTAAPKVSPNRPSRSTWRRRSSPLQLQLLASDRKPDAKGFARGGFLSLVIHTTVIASAIYATVTSRRSESSVKFDTALVMIAPQTPRHETPPPAFEVPLKGFQTVTVPTLIATVIPPVNLQEHFDPKDFTGVGVEGGVANGLMPSSDQVYASDIVDQKPALISAPPLGYPSLLREAGISGRVILQAVIDTAGRAEPGSIKVLESTSPAFEPSAKQWIQKALFRPARMAGRAVRVIVSQELDYTLTQTSTRGQ